MENTLPASCPILVLSCVGREGGGVLLARTRGGQPLPLGISKLARGLSLVVDVCWAWPEFVRRACSAIAVIRRVGRPFALGACSDRQGRGRCGRSLPRRGSRSGRRGGGARSESLVGRRGGNEWEIGATAAGEGAAGYGSSCVGKAAGRTRKVRLTVHADARGAPGAVDRRWVHDERHDVRMWPRGVAGRGGGGRRARCCWFAHAAVEAMTVSTAAGGSRREGCYGGYIGRGRAGVFEVALLRWHGRAERMETEADELDCQFEIGYR